MVENPSFSIRLMRYEDLDQALSLSVAEGWNQTIKDWKLLLANPHNICIVAEKDGIIAGTATALNHGNRIAWIGMVLVEKSLRGMGAGKMLLENIIHRVKNLESVKLDATPAGELLYNKLGFLAEYKVFRMRRNASNYSSGISPSKNPTSINQEIFTKLTSLDKVIFGADRSYLLNILFSNFPEKALYIKDEKGITGYMFGRDGSRFSYIGPVVADSTDTAKCLISRALESLPDQQIGIDVPEYQEELINWLLSVGFVNQRHFVRMYLDVNPFPGKFSRQYLIGGPEYG